MKVKCDYCDNTYEDNLSNCPSCGAVNSSPRAAGNDPRTIEELQKWYADRNLPPYSVTRFFIGEDYTGAKAFGIYKDPASQDIIVYKNKADGSRAVRYKGKDEEYAVNEILQKLKNEILKQKAAQPNSDLISNFTPNTSGSSKRRKKRRSSNSNIAIVIFIACITVLTGLTLGMHSHDGYYRYDDTVYYHYENNWYYYDDTYDDWFEETGSPDAIDNIKKSYDDYYLTGTWDSSIGASNWDNTIYYDETHSSDSDYDSDYDSDSSWSSDSDYDWDSGSSWDSDSSDWDSDW